MPMNSYQSALSGRMRVNILMTAVLALGFASAAPAKKKPPLPPVVLFCDAPTFQALATPDVTITTAAIVSTVAPVVTYCRVDGFVTTTGPAPTTNRVRFMVSLPEAGFNNRYFYVGQGGSAGSIPNPPAARLREGYAVATSDGGSPTSSGNYNFAVDRTKGLDWGSRGVHVGTLATQSITRQYYGLGNHKKDLYRYIDGCSGGGRMGNVEALLFPDDYDGVIAGAPGIHTDNITSFGRIAKYLLDNPDGWIPPAKMTEVSNAILARFDASDGALDGQIWDPRKIDVDFASLNLGLTSAQIATLKLVSESWVVNGQARQPYPGFGLGTPIGWSGFLLGTTHPSGWAASPVGRPAGFLLFGGAAQGVFGLGFDFTTQMNFNDPAQVTAYSLGWDGMMVGSGVADPTGYDRFRRAGGKILFWHGTADNGITVTDMMRYYDELEQHYGPRAQKFARLFLVPGMQHCAGGNGPPSVAAQTLEAITQWVEDGKAPESMVATRTAAPARTFLLCPYPKVSVFNGGLVNPNGLDVNDAANWVCRKDRKDRKDHDDHDDHDDHKGHKDHKDHKKP